MSNTTPSSATYVTSVSIDSASREITQTPADYTVQLPTSIQRVKSVRVGSAYIPNGAVSCIGTTYNNCVGYAEPIQFSLVGDGPTVVIQETITQTNLTTGTAVVFAVNTVTLTLPPTLNLINGAAGAAPVTITTTVNHGIALGLLAGANANVTWPGMSIVGGAYPILVAAPTTTYAPAVTAATATVGAVNTFDMTDVYLDTFGNSGALAHALRLTDAAGNAFVYAPEMTLSQLLLFLNNALSSIWAPTNLVPVGQTLMLRTYFSIVDVVPQQPQQPFGIPLVPYLVLKATPTTRIESGFKYVTTSKLMFTSTLNPFLGLFFAAVGGDGYDLTAGAQAPLSSVPSVRIVPLQLGDTVPTTFSDQPADIAANVCNAMSPFDFTTVTDPAARTISAISATGVTYAIVLPQGKFSSGTQLAAYIQAATVGPIFNATFTATAAGAGSLTISSPTGGIISLDFTATAVTTTATKLGFKPIYYTGNSSYTSNFIASNTGNSANSTIGQYSYRVSYGTFEQRFTVSTNPLTTVSTSAVVAPYSWLLVDGAAVQISPPRYVPGTVLQATYTIAAVTYTTTVVIAAAWVPVNGVSVNVAITPTPSIAVPAPEGSGQPAIGNPITLSVVSPNQFQLYFGAPYAAATMLGFPRRLLPASPLLNQVLSPNINTIDYLNGIPQSLSTGLGAAAIYIAPYDWELQGPPYILLQLKPIPPVGPTGANVHVYNNEEYAIIAKFYIRALPYQHIAEELLEIPFSGYVTVGAVSLKFLNPDGSVTDFNGKNNSLTLLFQSYMNTVSGMCP